MALNIVGSKGDKTDPAFRYKMPRLIGKVEGRGNGIKTVIVNAADVAGSLHRPTSHFTKFFGCELGAQAKWDSKSEKSIVNGAHPTRDLQQLVDRYCDLFVLCPGCNLPETSLKIKSSKKEIWHVCKACGAKNMVDMSHKLCTFILKEAAKAKKARKGKKGKEGKEGKRSKRGEKGEKGSESSKSKGKKKSSRSKAAKAAVAVEDDDQMDENGITWFTDFSECAVKDRKASEIARMEENSGGQEEVDQGLSQDPEQILAEAVSRVRRGVAGGWSDTKVKVEVINLQVAGGLPQNDRLRIIFNAVLNGLKKPSEFNVAIEKNKGLFTSVVEQLATGKEDLIACAMKFFAAPENAPSAAAVAVVLQAFYDFDLLSEEDLLGWYKRPLTEEEAQFAVIKMKATPLIEWLQEPDSEEEESGEED